ncbi:hypothetical protein QW131_00190 [Roseibium salinum]|nr:hypothetical protein [Roseibium salinum]
MNELPHQILEHPAEPGWKTDFEAFLAAHPDLDTLEVILPDTNGVLRGKWLPGKALQKVFEQGVALPFFPVRTGRVGPRGRIDRHASGNRRQGRRLLADPRNAEVRSLGGAQDGPGAPLNV